MGNLREPLFEGLVYNFVLLVFDPLYERGCEAAGVVPELPPAGGAVQHPAPAPIRGEHSGPPIPGHLQGRHMMWPAGQQGMGRERGMTRHTGHSTTDSRSPSDDEWHVACDRLQVTELT